MRNIKGFIADITKKPPIVFPLVALFHVLWLLWTIWDDRHEPMSDIVYLQIAWIAVFTVFWIAACDYRKWGAFGCILLTVVDISLLVAIKNGNSNLKDYLYNLCPADVLFSIVLMYYYKHFR